MSRTNETVADFGTTRLECVTYYREENAYLCGHLHARKGWHFFWRAVGPQGEVLSGVIRGPFPTEAAASMAAQQEASA